MTIGIIIVSFGVECDKIASHCVAYSRQFTNLPITIITNVDRHRRHKKWDEVKDIDFIQSTEPTHNNRKIKTTIIEYTPYDYSIYMDADSIIQKPEFDEEILKMIEDTPDLILNHFCTYPNSENKFQNIYLRASKHFECEDPLLVYNGAFIGFANNERTKEFFTKWNKYWMDFGWQREMPPLSCAVNKMTELSICILPDNFFCPDHKNEDAVVQHNYNDDFWTKIGHCFVELPQAHFQEGDYGFTEILK